MEGDAVARNHSLSNCENVPSLRGALHSLVELRDFEDKWSREKQEALALDNTEQGETSGFSEAVEIALTQWALRDIESTAIEAEEAIANGSIESARILIKTIRDRATSARRESPRFF